MIAAPIIGDLTPLDILVLIVGLVIVWVIVSIPVYLAGKVVTAGESTLGDAMVASLLGPVVYAITFFTVDFLLGSLVGLSSSYILALVLAFIAWIYVFKASFGTGWLGGFAIAILAILIFAAISLLFGLFLGVMVPTPFFPRF